MEKKLDHYLCCGSLITIIAPMAENIMLVESNVDEAIQTNVGGTEITTE